MTESGNEDCFKFYDCPVCFESFSLDNDLKKPLFLSCFHSVCRTCSETLVNQIDVLEYRNNGHYFAPPMCPICRKPFEVPAGGLTPNFYITNLLEEQSRQRRQENNSQLLTWCVTCEKIAEEKCHLHKTEKLASALCSLATTHQNLSTTLKEKSTEFIKASSKYIKDDIELFDPLKYSVTEFKEFIQTIYKLFDAIQKSKIKIRNEMVKLRSNVHDTAKKCEESSIYAWTSHEPFLVGAPGLPRAGILKAEGLLQTDQVRMIHQLQSDIAYFKREEKQIDKFRPKIEKLNSRVSIINPCYFIERLSDVVENVKKNLVKRFSEVNALHALDSNRPTLNGRNGPFVDPNNWIGVGKCSIEDAIKLLFDS